MLRPEIFTRARDWPSLASAHPKVGWGPPKKFWSPKFKIWPKIQRFKVNNFRASGSILTGFFSVDAPLGRGVKFGYNFYKARPPKFVTAKKSSKIFSDFWQLSTLIANISGMDQQIRKWNSSWKSTTPPTLDENKLVYFGPQTKKLLSWINLHPNGLYSGDYILALRGCCPLKFYTR